MTDERTFRFVQLLIMGLVGVVLGAFLGYQYARAHQIIVMFDQDGRTTCEIQP